MANEVKHPGDKHIAREIAKGYELLARCAERQAGKSNLGEKETL